MQQGRCATGSARDDPQNRAPVAAGVDQAACGEGVVKVWSAIGLVSAVTLAACGQPAVDHDVFTLYRSSVDGIEVIHVATFDTGHGREYNETNCTISRDLMKSQPGVTVAYWCAPGRFRKP